MRDPRRATAVAVVVALSLVGVAGCTGGNASMSSGDGQGFITSDGTVQIVDPADRVAAPELTGEALTGDQVSTADFAGDVVVINLWASWCGPCRAEAPALQQVSTDTVKKGVSFLGINSRDQTAAALAFENNFGITYPSLIDDSGELELLVAEAVPLSGIPWTIIVDQDGLIAVRILGPTTYSQLSDLVDEVASEG